MEERTERESDGRKREEKWQTSWCCKERAEWRSLQRKNLNILGLPKRKEWPHCRKDSSWQVRRSRLCQNEKEQSRLSRVPDHEGERVKVGESRSLARKRGIRVGAWSGKGRRKHERVSGCKSSPGRSAESWFHS